MSRHRRPPRGTATAQANGWAPEPRTVAERQPAKGPDSKRMPDVLLAAESPGRHRARARPPGRLQTSSLSDAAFETFQLLTQRPFLVLDCEYTRDPDGDGARLISMAVVPVVRGARSTAQELYVVMNPGLPVDPASTAVHGFTDADVRRKRRLAHYAPAILDALRLPDAVLVTHTGADVRVLRRELERLDEGRGEGVDDPEAPGLAALPDMPIIDTSTLPGSSTTPA